MHYDVSLQSNVIIAKRQLRIAHSLFSRADYFYQENEHKFINFQAHQQYQLFTFETTFFMSKFAIDLIQPCRHLPSSSHFTRFFRLPSRFDNDQKWTKYSNNFLVIVLLPFYIIFFSFCRLICKKTSSFLKNGIRMRRVVFVCFVEKVVFLWNEKTECCLCHSRQMS